MASTASTAVPAGHMCRQSLKLATLRWQPSLKPGARGALPGFRRTCPAAWLPMQFQRSLGAMHFSGRRPPRLRSKHGRRVRHRRVRSDVDCHALGEAFELAERKLRRQLERVDRITRASPLRGPTTGSQAEWIERGGASDRVPFDKPVRSAWMLE